MEIPILLTPKIVNLNDSRVIKLVPSSRNVQKNTTNINDMSSNIIPSFIPSSRKNTNSSSRTSNSIPLVKSSRTSNSIPFVKSSRTSNSIPLVKSSRTSNSIPLVKSSHTSGSIPFVKSSRTSSATTSNYIPFVKSSRSILVKSSKQYTSFIPDFDEFDKEGDIGSGKDKCVIQSNHYSTIENFNPKDYVLIEMFTIPSKISKVIFENALNVYENNQNCYLAFYDYKQITESEICIKLTQLELWFKSFKEPDEFYKENFGEESPVPKRNKKECSHYCDPIAKKFIHL